MRYDDWDIRLFDAIEVARARAFTWGTHDCALFAADAVLAMTGVDYAADLRGKYDTQARALRLLVKTPLRVRVTETLGAPVAPAFAQRGDVVMSGEGALGICVGESSVFIGPQGIETRATLAAECAWRVA